MKNIIVVGGGAAGLSAAYKLLEEAKARSLDVNVLLLEKNDRIGGTILTERKNGCIIEGGPDCFLSEKPWALSLAAKIGFKDKVKGTIEKNKGTFIMWNGKLEPLPDGVMLMVPTRIMPLVTASLLSWPGKIRMGMDVFIPKRKDGKDESLAEFVKRRLGQEALDRIAEPLVAGVHAGHPESMSLASSFPRFKALEDQYGSLILGMLARMKSVRQLTAHAQYTMFVTFENGLTEFMEAVADPIEIRKSCAVSTVRRDGASWKLILASGEEIAADAVIFATPAHVTSSIMRKLDSELAGELDAIPYTGTATASLAFDPKDVEGKLKGFGFVIPRKENRGIMAATYTSRKFPNRTAEGVELIRCFVGGIQRPDLVEMAPEKIAQISADEIKSILGIKADPIWGAAYSWPKSMPQAIVGHADRMKRIRNSLAAKPGIDIAGGAYEGLGIPDCIRVGQDAAQRIIDSLFGAPQK